MKTIKAETGSKRVEIIESANGFRATLLQRYNTGIGFDDRFIEMKNFSTEKRAVNWANKNLK